MLPDKIKNFKLSRNQKIAIGLGVAAVGGIIIYNIIKNNQDDKTGKPGSGSAATPQQDFTDKVKVLQKLVGATTDGIIGPKTKEALAKYGITVAVTSANIDGFINTLTAKVAATNVDAARYARAMQLYNAITKVKGKKFKFTKAVKYYWKEKDIFGKWNNITVPNLPYNAFGLIPANKETISWNTGDVVDICLITVDTRGFIYIKPKSYLGDCYPYFGGISPYDATVI
jgi:hypothetical protein